MFSAKLFFKQNVPVVVGPRITSPKTASFVMNELASYQITASGIPEIILYELSGTLPYGMYFNPSTGLISGAPNIQYIGGVPVEVPAVKEITIDVYAWGRNGVYTGASVKLLVYAPLPVFVWNGDLTSQTFGIFVSEPTSLTLPVLYSPHTFTATNIPPGMSLDTATGLISGTPTQTGSFLMELTATNSTGTSSSTFTFIVTAKVPIITSLLNLNDVTGGSFSYQITATRTPTSYAATGLPSGMSINPTTGLITGTVPNTAGKISFTITATNNIGTSLENTVNLTIIELVDVSSEWEIMDAPITGTYASPGPPQEYGVITEDASYSLNNYDKVYFPVIGSDVKFIRLDTKNNSFLSSYATVLTNRQPYITGPVTEDLAPSELIGGWTLNQTLGMTSVNYMSTTEEPVMMNGSDLPFSFKYSTRSQAALSPGVSVGLVRFERSFSGNLWKYIASATPDGCVTIGSDTYPDDNGVKYLGVIVIGAYSTFNPNYCKTIAATDTHILLGGGNAGLGYLGRVEVTADLVDGWYDAPPIPWEFIPFEGGVISKLAFVKVYLNYTTAAWNSRYSSLNSMTQTSILLVGTMNGAIGTSLDSGSTWSYPTNQPFGAGDRIAGFGASSIKIYAVTTTGKIAVSADGGVTWKRLKISTGAGATSLNFVKQNTVTDYAKNFLYDPSVGSALSVKQKSSVYIGGNGFLARGPGDFVYNSGNISPPVINSALTVNTNVNSLTTYQITATNNPTSYTDSDFAGFSASGLPAGFVINKYTGLIHGQPTAAGTFTVTITASNPAGTGSASLSLNIAQAISGIPVITSAKSATGMEGSQLNYQITATGNPTSYTSTTLPSGLTLNSTSGLLGGIPTISGDYTIKISATNSVGTGETWLTISLAPEEIIDTYRATLSSSRNLTAYLGVPFSYVITSHNNLATSFAVTHLPPGLSLNTATGVISGTPTSDGYGINRDTNTRVVTVTLHVDNPSYDTRRRLESLTITVIYLPVITSTLTRLITNTNNNNISYQITASNNPTSFSATGLPAGLSLNTSTGLITGTLSSQGTYSGITLGATNAMGAGATKTLTITVLLAPVITSSTANLSLVTGTAFNYQITASNNPNSFAVEGLPTGLYLGYTGNIQGTPTTAGSATITVKANNAAGTGSATISLLVQNPPSITSATTFDMVAQQAGGTSYTYTIQATGNPTTYSAANLPDGMSMASPASLGQIIGAPYKPGVYTVTVYATDSIGTGSANITFTASQNTAVVRSKAQNDIIGIKSGTSADYQPIQILGDTTTFYEAINLPSGLSINSRTGRITGIPIVTGRHNATLRSWNANGAIDSSLIFVIADFTEVNVPVFQGPLTYSRAIDITDNLDLPFSNSPTSYISQDVPTGMGHSSIYGTLYNSYTGAASSSRVLVAAVNAGGLAKTHITINWTPEVIPPVITSKLNIPVRSVGNRYSYSEPGVVEAGTRFSYQMKASGRNLTYSTSGVINIFNVTSYGLVTVYLDLLSADIVTYTIPITVSNSAGSVTENLVISRKQGAVKVVTSTDNSLDMVAVLREDGHVDEFYPGYDGPINSATRETWICASNSYKYVSDPIVDISVANDYILALTDKGKVHAWSTTPKTSFSPFDMLAVDSIYSSGIAKIAAGTNVMLALKNDGTLLASYSPRRSDSYWVSLLTPPSGTFKEIAIASNSPLALRTNGTIVSWGSTSFPISEANNNNIAQIAAGAEGYMYLKNDQLTRTSWHPFLTTWPDYNYYWVNQANAATQAIRLLPDANLKGRLIATGYVTMLVDTSRNRGSYDSTKEYLPGDIVKYTSNYWIRLRSASTGVAPPASTPLNSVPDGFELNNWLYQYPYEATALNISPIRYYNTVLAAQGKFAYWPLFPYDTEKVPAGLANVETEIKGIATTLGVYIIVYSDGSFVSWGPNAGVGLWGGR